MATYKEQWKASKRLFETTTKLKKPSAKVDSTFRKSPGLDTACTDLDKYAAKIAKETVTQAELDKYKEALTAFKSAKLAYMNVLNQTVGAEPTGADKVVYQKGVAVLKTRLEAIEANAILMGKNAKGVVNKVPMQDNIAKNLIRSATAKTAALEAYLTAQKARPNAKGWNAKILTYTRDVNQSIGNVQKLTAKGYVFQHAAQPDLFNRLSPWAGGQRKLAETASAEAVEAEVEVLMSIVKAVKIWLAGG
jgi:hypothetical protein